MMQVIDASAVVSALIDDSTLGSWCAERLTEADLAAPHLMPFEAANIVRRTVARGALSPSDGGSAVQDLGALTIDYLPWSSVAERVWALRDNLTAYDASYVAAAELLDCRLVTIDTRLARAPGLRCEVLVAPDLPASPSD